MKEPIITDSACLIGLERIGQLDLLPALFEPIMIPPEVDREFGITLAWLRIEVPSDTMMVATLKLLVDDGEAEAIALAGERGVRLILDDRQARLVAKNLGIPIIGTVGILAQAKRAGIITSLKPVLSELEAKGFYISNALKAEALRIVGE
ncbi:MAG TPA: DUF3368 domain-containing protein [Candidatus Saccharimonadales bacterium]|nr:DUF3368 domain-containing protein [Candidatus Saccharimonadales bacterium]